MSWHRLGGEVVFDATIFRLRRDAYEFGGEPTHPYYVLESPPWINVVPLTPEREVVLVRQYRHGIEGPSLEVPGGLADPGEDPAAAAVRELREETGYAGAPPQLLAAVTSNPAILTNRTHCFVVPGARPVAPPTPDPHEELEVEVVPVARLLPLIRSGEIHHSLSVVALTLFLLADADT